MISTRFALVAEQCLLEHAVQGLTKLLLWPPFVDVPTAKTMDDMTRIKDEILPAAQARVTG